MPDLAQRLAVARGDEPADLVVRGGRVFSVFTREWLDTDVAVVDGYVAGLGDYEGAETIDASGRFVVPGFVRAPRPAAGDDGLRRRPARDRERARHGRRPLAARRLRGAAARRLLHGLLL